MVKLLFLSHPGSGTSSFSREAGWFGAGFTSSSISPRAEAFGAVVYSDLPASSGRCLARPILSTIREEEALNV